MIIDKDTIMYFSGTGNSLQVCKDIVKELNNFELFKIAELPKDKIEVKAKSLGIVFPVYYDRIPLLVEEFVKRLDISSDTYVFGVVTYGGFPGRVIIRLENILQDNGFKLNAGFLVHMPPNYILAYNASSIKRQNKIFQKEKLKINEIVAVIKYKKEQPCKVSKLKFDVLIDKVFTKTTDKIMKNLHVKDKGFWVKDNCNGCRICEKICPANNIEFKDNKPTWKHNCEVCVACIQNCPREAIQWGNKTTKRKRYRNPDISINELIGSK
ncbi:4Fe-4S dicluster domain-containing protein [Clostridium sp. 19966]|uniref:EFR1 family ferrodoxin n=1 Tax=Clostridium sp. 19966 TaxID=2768166 RepID=UPI0028DF2C5A|nr:EFR1 family ferrodoxin [Clostridium sp. 19966]MDT8716866.1 4Fe-4S dicluster domain-containing protein [Clostridium sp. 19966]